MKRIRIVVMTLAIILSSVFSITGEESRNAGIPRLVDLGAKKCIPCKMMSPILDQLTADYKGVLEVEFIDVWQQENAEQAEKFGIRSIPTQIFISPDGKELFRHEGFFAKEDILAKWKELGFDLSSKKSEK